MDGARVRGALQTAFIARERLLSTRQLHTQTNLSPILPKYSVVVLQIYCSSLALQQPAFLSMNVTIMDSQVFPAVKSETHRGLACFERDLQGCDKQRWTRYCKETRR